jgi:hypothetical protein
MAVRGKETATMLPKPGPEFLAVGRWQLQVSQGSLGEELKPALGVDWRENRQLRLHFKQEHEPVGLALITVFTDDSGEVQIVRLELLVGFFARFATGAGVRRLAFVGVQFAAGWTPKAAVWFLRAFEQENLVASVEAVEQGGDFIGQFHRASESGTGKSRKKPEVAGYAH